MRRGRGLAATVDRARAGLRSFPTSGGADLPITMAPGDRRRTQAAARGALPGGVAGGRILHCQVNHHMGETAEFNCFCYLGEMYIWTKVSCTLFACLDGVLLRIKNKMQQSMDLVFLSFLHALGKEGFLSVTRETKVLLCVFTNSSKGLGFI